jgi:hypothetical protein
MANQPGDAVLTIFDTIIERIKSSRPLGTDNKPIERGFVYSQLVLGQMVDPDDFANAWSPMGGSTVGDAVKQGQLPPDVGATIQTSTPPATGVAPASAAPASAAPAGMAAAPDTPPAAPTAADVTGAKIRRAIKAAYNTSQLVDRMLMVTKDEVMRLYPGNGRTISFAYDGIINGMQPLPAPPIAPDVQKRIDEARKVLYELDENGDIDVESKLLKRYKKNARKYAEAKADFADAQADAMRDPSKAEAWPMKSVTYQNAVDEAYDTLKTEGAEKVERALGIIESIGLSIQDRMIAKARKLLDVWSLGLAGVPTQTPYSMVLPSGWADPEEDDDGWMKLTVKNTDYSNHTARNTHFFQQSSSHADASATSGGGHASYFGFGGGGGGGSTSTHDSSQGSVDASSKVHFANDAENLEITLEYGLCDVYRPWLVGDLFYMKNWYLVNNPANAISDGTFEHQADSTTTLLPMIPTQFLVIRNVKIRSSKWNSDGVTFDRYFGSGRSDTSTSASNVQGSAGFAFGPISFGASASHSESKNDTSQSSGHGSSGSRDYEASFKEGVLEIKGAQVIAWLSSIVPACPTLDDPGLKKNAAAPASNTAKPTPQSGPAPAASPA